MSHRPCPPLCERDTGCRARPILYKADQEKWYCEFCIQYSLGVPSCCQENCRSIALTFDEETQLAYCIDHADRCESQFGYARHGDPLVYGSPRRPCILRARHRVRNREYCNVHEHTLTQLSSAADVFEHGLPTLQRSPGILSSPQIGSPLSQPAPAPPSNVTAQRRRSRQHVRRSANRVYTSRTPIDLTLFTTMYENECSICLDSFSALRELRVCGHKFCADCLTKQVSSSLTNAHKCALCRHDVFDLLRR